jgi:hypothetical protein
VIAALLAAALLLADGRRFTVDVPHGPVALGQRFEVVVSGEVAADAKLAVPAPPDGLMADVPKLVEESGQRTLHWPLRAVREGEFTLSGLSVKTGEQTDALPDARVSVTFDASGDLPPAVAPLLPPVRVPYAPAHLLPIAGALGLALLLLGGLVARAGRVIVVPPAPPRPPELVAAEALARLRNRLPRAPDDVPAFVVEVSGVLRAYIEGRYGLHAPESTTEEFLSAATAHPALAGHKDVLAPFLTGCDLVKFARHRPEPASMAGLLATAEGFVEATRA